MKLFKIEENDANQRLDKFLKKLFPNATRSLIYKLNRKEKIKVLSRNLETNNKDITGHLLTKSFDIRSNNKFKKKDNEYKLQVGDEVKIFLSDEEFKKLTKNELNTVRQCHSLAGPENQLLSVILSKSFGEKNNTLKSKQKEIEKLGYIKDSEINSEGHSLREGRNSIIVFEDSDLLVLNKNAGINVHPGDYKTKEISLIQQIHDYLGNKCDSLTFQPSLVHRIDRDTSGILLIAKKKNILQKLVNDFKNHTKIKKVYYAIVLGKMPEKNGTITKKLERIKNAKNENKVQISEKGQEAVTHYSVLNEFFLKTKEGNLIISELEVEIKTGRMHQIRVHLADLGNPILGDKIYGNKKLNAFLEKNYGLERQALHAWKIEFFHYGKEKKMKLEARIKDDLKDFIKKEFKSN